MKSIRPGIHSQVKNRKEIFKDDVWSIIERFSEEWYITNGNIVKTNTSEYSYCLLKPCENYQNLFNLEREIILLISTYEEFEPRTLDAIDKIIKKNHRLRIDRICSVLASRCPTIVEDVKRLLISDQEIQVIIPFSFEDIKTQRNSYFLRNRFKEHFFSRDLFDFEAPLKKDIFFFGRNDLVQKIVNRHISFENTGLFGLRRTGKTSVIFGLQRLLPNKNGMAVIIDCQNPAFHKRRWHEALYFLSTQIKKVLNLDIRINESHFSEKNAPLKFEGVLAFAKKHLGTSVLLVFDEIENISFKTSPTNHWSDGLDFIFFWQTLRSVFQSNNCLFSFLIVGTNPLCVEKNFVNGKENPLFEQISISYMPSFSTRHTREMVRTIGRLMGLRFEEILYSKMTEDFGGHPFLIRQFCSLLHKTISQERPVFVDKTVYSDSKENFLRTKQNYIEMVLNVLSEFYEDELAMLIYLATEQFDVFDDLVSLSPSLINHLLGYGIISKGNMRYYFNLELVKEYLIKKHQFNKANQTIEEMRSEISKRRNAIEERLRKIIKISLRQQLGEAAAINKILKVKGDRTDQSKVLTLEQLFESSHENKIYFMDLSKIISSNWDVFKHTMGDRDDTINALRVINKFRKVDAHASQVSKDEMAEFRVNAKKIESIIEAYFK